MKTEAKVTIKGVDNYGDSATVTVKHVNATPDQTKLRTFGNAFAAVSDFVTLVYLKHVKTETTEVELEEI